MEEVAKSIRKARRGSTWDDADIEKRPIAARLIVTRLALGFGRKKKTLYANGAGIPPNLYGLYEKFDDKRIVTIGQAIRLCDTYSLTLDWIYRGVLPGLSSDLQDKILRQQSKPDPFSP
jgi:hypothetical protein